MPSFWKRKDAGNQAKEGGIAPAKIAKAAPVGAEDGQEQVYFVTITYPPQVRFSMEPDTDSSDSNISFSEDDFRALLKDIKKNVADPIYLKVQKLECDFFMYSNDFNHPSKAVVTVSIEDKSGKQLNADKDPNVKKITDRIKEHWESPRIQLWL